MFLQRIQYYKTEKLGKHIKFIYLDFKVYIEAETTTKINKRRQKLAETIKIIYALPVYIFTPVHFISPFLPFSSAVFENTKRKL